MDEFVVLIASSIYAAMFWYKWYDRVMHAWPPERVKLARRLLAWLPVVAVAVIVFTLRVLASFDVVDSFFYIVFYIILGAAWMAFGLFLMTVCFDLSWADDALNLGNKAALSALAGGLLGVTLIYAGANIGDGPGWWCVIFAGGLGLIAWLLLGRLVNLLTKAFERVTVERDLGCGIRFGFYLLASGILLARASAGDWTSFRMTLLEFLDGWPVLILTVLMVAVERFYHQKAKHDFYSTDSQGLTGSLAFGLLYLLLAVLCVTLLPPLPVNPYYGGLAALW